MSNWQPIFTAPRDTLVEVIYGQFNDGEVGDEYTPEICQARLVRVNSEFPFAWVEDSGDDLNDPWGWRPISEDNEAPAVLLEPTMKQEPLDIPRLLLFWCWDNDYEVRLCIDHRGRFYATLYASPTNANFDPLRVNYTMSDYSEISMDAALESLSHNIDNQLKDRNVSADKWVHTP